MEYTLSNLRSILYAIVPTMKQRPSAVEQVFAIPELLQLIISNLPVYTLYKVRYVNQTFRTLCEQSPLVGRKMILVQPPAQPVQTSGWVAFNPWVRALFTRSTGHNIRAWCEREGEHGPWQPVVKVTIELRS